MAASLHAFLHRGSPLTELAEVSDGLDPSQRVEAVGTLTARELARLWDLAANSAAQVGLDFLVPRDVPKEHTVEWIGRNSLPVFNAFTKRFTRSAEPDTLIGQNTGPMQWLIGPGYFTAMVRPGKPSELLLDYTRVPAQPPAGWPPVRDNDRGVSRLVFADMHDYLRPIGAHLAIGAAFTSAGKPRGQYFALARGAVLPFGD